MKPSDVRFEEQWKGFAFNVEILGQRRQCMISLEAVEHLFGKPRHHTTEDWIATISKAERLAQIASDIAIQSGPEDPLILTLPGVSRQQRLERRRRRA